MTSTRADVDLLTKMYGIWLGGKVTRGSRHLELLEILYNKEFVWVVANDDNRIQDGMDLRREFLLDAHFSSAFNFQHHSVREHELLDFKNRFPSVLEVLIGISRRLAFAVGGIPEVWAWKLVENLELHTMRDPISPRKRDQIDERLDALIFRTYTEDGVGGFFPLAYPDQDQTKVEIWYQMSAWIEENKLP